MKGIEFIGKKVSIVVEKGGFGSGWMYYDTSCRKARAEVVWSVDVDKNLGRWEHVSIKMRDRDPMFSEIIETRNAFFARSENVIITVPTVQSEGRMSKYVVHLWHPIDTSIEIP